MPAGASRLLGPIHGRGVFQCSNIISNLKGCMHAWWTPETYRMDDEKTEFYILDLSGKIVKKVFLPIINENIVETYPLSIIGGNVYQVVENEVEEWDLHVIPVK
jgi:hypothetical protein